MRIPDKCNHNPETTVLAHYRMGGLGSGTGRKPDDLFGAYCCSGCHDVVDLRDLDHFWSRDEIMKWFAEGVFRTQKILLEMGLIKCE